MLIVERWILARLSKLTLCSPAELNREIRRLLAELNERPFQKLEGTRCPLFETLGGSCSWEMTAPRSSTPPVPLRLALAPPEVLLSGN